MTVSFHGRARRAVALPVEALVDDDATSGSRGAESSSSGSRSASSGSSSGDVGQHVGRVPVDRALDRLRVRVDEQLGRVEAVALLGLVGAVRRGSRSAGRGRRRAGSSASWTPCARRPRCAPRRRRRRTGTARRASACSENSEKFVPSPSQVAPSGNGRPGQTSRLTRRHQRSRAAGRRTTPSPRRRRRAWRAPRGALDRHRPRAPRSCTRARRRRGARAASRRRRRTRRRRIAGRQLAAQRAAGAGRARAISGSPHAGELGALERRRVLRVGDVLAGERGEGRELLPAALAGGLGDAPRRCGR